MLNVSLLGLFLQRIVLIKPLMRILPGITLLHNSLRLSINFCLKISISIERHIDINIPDVTRCPDQDILAPDSQQSADQTFVENSFLFGHYLVQQKISLIHVRRFPLKVHLLQT